jgi:hypothetical protein
MGTFRVEVEIDDMALRLTVDPVGRRLVPVPGLLMEFAA